MRVVCDTNVLIAAFLAHGTCHEVLEHCIQHHEIIVSRFILQEMKHALINKLKYSRQDVNTVERLLKTRLILVTPVPLDIPICRDPDDDTILGTALAGTCRCIITGDKDLLVLQRYRDIDLVSPSGFWQYESARLE